MNRVQRFRELRHFRMKLAMTFMLFILILCVGIGVADYSMSGLLKDEKGFGIFSVNSYGEDYYRISFFDNAIYINTKYVARDYKRLTDWVEMKKRNLGLKD